MDASYRFGIEEEFFLADARTRGAARRSLKAFHAAVHAELPDVERELMQAQVEIASQPTTEFATARAELAERRSRLDTIGRTHGIRVIASGTHPLARWQKQQQTEKDRYDTIMRDLQILGRRDVVCGMHVHVEVPRPEERVSLMARVLPFLPLLLALSASSPFWQGRPTGLAAYRLSVWGEMPRTGFPELFANSEDYDRYVATMVRCGAIADASYLWWTVRPSTHFPTLELRVSDSCTRLEDALTIAALYRCLVRCLVRRPEVHGTMTAVTRGIALENLWRAQRHGIRAALIDEASDAALPFSDALERVLALVGEDAAALGCEPEVERARTIVASGTSADHQLKLFEQYRREAGMVDALGSVVDWLADTTAGRC